MSKNCGKGFKNLKGICIPGKKKIVSTASNIPSIIIIILTFSLLSAGGWLVFSGIIGITGLENSSHWLQLLIGLSILTGATILGWRKFK